MMVSVLKRPSLAHKQTFKYPLFLWVIMHIDIVFPEDNEEEFIAMAEKLDWQGLCFVYETKSKAVISSKRKQLQELKEKTKLKLFIGLLLKPKEVAKLRKDADLIIVKSSKDDRYVLEQACPDLVFGLEESSKKDNVHYLQSGLDHVLCNLAQKNKIMVGISFARILNSDTKTRVHSMARIRQNTKLCRKYKVEVTIASFAQSRWEMRSPHDLKSWGIVAGMQPAQAKAALESVNHRLARNSRIQQGLHIADGVDIIK